LTRAPDSGFAKKDKQGAWISIFAVVVLGWHFVGRKAVATTERVCHTLWVAIFRL